jgi:hypothetical protein
MCAHRTVRAALTDRRSASLRKSRNPLSWRILIVGLVIILVSLFADGLGMGDTPGLGKGQVVGLGLGVALAFLGLMSATSQ